MKIGKKLRRDTLVIVLSVIVLTLTTMRVSYAAFFTVRSKSTMQIITTGNLEIYIDGDTSESITLEELFPTPTSELPTPDEPRIDEASEGTYAKLILSNKEDSYDAEYVISVGNDEIPEGKEAINLKYVYIGIYDRTNTAWHNFGTAEEPKYYVSIDSLTPSSDNLYPVLNGQLLKGDNVKYDIYIWLAENTPAEEIGKLVYLKLTVDSTTLNDGDDIASSSVEGG